MGLYALEYGYQETLRIKGIRRKERVVKAALFLFLRIKGVFEKKFNPLKKEQIEGAL